MNHGIAKLHGDLLPPEELEGVHMISDATDGRYAKITVGENMSSTGTISLLPAAPILRSSIKQSFKFHLETQPQRPTTLRSTVDFSTSKPCCIAGFEFCQNHPPPGSLPTTDVVSCEKASKNNCTQREFKMVTKVFPFYQKIMQ